MATFRRVKLPRAQSTPSTPCAAGCVNEGIYAIRYGGGRVRKGISSLQDHGHLWSCPVCRTLWRVRRKKFLDPDTIWDYATEPQWARYIRRRQPSVPVLQRIFQTVTR